MPVCGVLYTEAQNGAMGKGNKEDHTMKLRRTFAVIAAAAVAAASAVPAYATSYSTYLSKVSDSEEREVQTRSYEFMDTAKCYIGFRCVQPYLGRVKGDNLRTASNVAR